MQEAHIFVSIHVPTTMVRLTVLIIMFTRSTVRFINYIKLLHIYYILNSNLNVNNKL